MPLTVRQAASFDYNSIEALMRTSRRSTIGVRDERSFWWLCEDARSGAAVGCIGLETEGAFGLLRPAALAPARKGSGLDRDLIECVEKAARELRLSRVFAFSTGPDDTLVELGWERATMRDIVEALPNAPRIRALLQSGGERGPTIFTPGNLRAYVRLLGPHTHH